jgi:phosphoribosylglycinamide formyltransferase-1
MLCGKAQSSRIMYHELASHFEVVSVILEDKPSMLRLMIRRAKRLGVWKVGGQMLFFALYRVLLRRSQSRIKELMHRYGLRDQPFPKDLVVKVKSVNDRDTVRTLEELDPGAVVINGTRIISKAVLSCVKAPFVNTHMGITPRYRGVHGGYWALAHNDAKNCGITVHLVDPGIDTGGVLYQDVIVPELSDNIATYPVHQIARGIPLMRKALHDIEAGRLQVTKGVLPSRLWYHPTVAEYVRAYLRYRVK